MSLLASIPFVGHLLGGSSHTPTVRLDPVPIHDIEDASEKRPRTLKHLLRGNHVNHALVNGSRNSNHNHLAHALCSAYLLGATPEHLNDIYEAIAPRLAPWTSSPAEMADVDWHDFLGDANYQRAYVDFFEDVLAEHSVAYDWHKVVSMYMLGEGRAEAAAEEGFMDDAAAARAPAPPPDPLVSCLISGLGHPLIHIAYAFEMDSRVLAMEALAIASVDHSAKLQSILDNPMCHDSSGSPDLQGLPLRDLLDRLTHDERFDAVARDDVDAVLTELPPDTEAALAAYWNAWSLDSPDLTPRLHEAQDVAVALLVATVAPGTHNYNFLLCHVLTTSHAVRVLLPKIPAKFHAGILRQWWLLTLAVYVAVGRPGIDLDNALANDKDKGWAYVEKQALSSQWNTDAHYVQAIHAMIQATRTWGDTHNQYLSAAIQFADDFAGWAQ